MTTRLFGFFSSTQVTILIGIALTLPGAVFAAVNFSNVAITNPSTGMVATVDAQQRLRVYDQTAGYTKNIGRSVNISDYVDTTGGAKTVYTIPAGYVLLIKSITWNYFYGSEGTNSYSYYYDYNDNILMNFEGTHIAGTESATFDAPIIVREGALTFSVAGTSSVTARTYVQGFLAPASAVPAPSSAEARQQFVAAAKSSRGERPQ